MLFRSIDAVKRDAGQKNKPLSNYVDIDDAKHIPAESEPLSSLLKKEYANKVSKVIKTQLTLYEKQVLQLFIEGYSYEDIAEKTNKSYKAVDGALQRARKKLLVAKE